MFNRNRSYTLLIIFTFLLGSCTNEKEADLSLVEVEDLTYQLLPSGARIVSGVLNNPTEIALGSIQLEVSLFDENNIRVDGLSILVRDIGANAKVPFRQPIDSDFEINAARVKGMIKL